MAGTFYATPLSLTTQRALVVAYEAGIGSQIDILLVDVAAGEHKSETHKKLQPFGLVPAYVSKEGLKLFESRAIARYLDGRAGGKLTRRNNPDEEALVDVWAQVEQSYFDKHAIPIILYLELNTFYKLPLDPAAAEKELVKFNPILDTYEEQLSTRSFLAGNFLSVADLYHLPVGAILFRLRPDLLEKRPHLAKWWKTISSLESWTTVQALAAKHKL